MDCRLPLLAAVQVKAIPLRGVAGAPATGLSLGAHPARASLLFQLSRFLCGPPAPPITRSPRHQAIPVGRDALRPVSYRPAWPDLAAQH
jgi:hypothetical protein